MTDSLYPPTPAGVPPELTRPHPAYRRRVAAMIAGLFVFLVVYVGLVALSGLFAVWIAFIPDPKFDTGRGSGKGAALYFLVKYGGAVAVGLLSVFLLKGLFKGQKAERGSTIPLKPADHPELFAFIRRVYEDTGAPPPRRVYVSPQVNAALIYDTSLINLIVPPKKDLLIGLGLVNVVTLAEFKAVLAHEFGHFAQRSVGLGSYLYVANRVVQDVVYQRDGFDRALDTWSRIDIRLSLPAWALKGILWVVRAGLSQLYKGLNLLHLSLSRQMEFNADNVAVSVTGSDALIHCLSRLQFASESLGDAATSLDAAADRGVFTADLFAHQLCSADRLRRLRKDARLGLPPDLPADPTAQVTVFTQDDADGTPERYRSHPSDAAREANAKRFYVRSPGDDRSPWLLFGDPAGLKLEVTGLFYHRDLGRKELYVSHPAAEVQAVIDAEHAETTYDPKYHGWYDDRIVNPGDLTDLPPAPWPRDRVAAWLATWPPADLESRVEFWAERQSELSLLRGIESGNLSLKGSTFPFRDKPRRAKEVPALIELVDGELTENVTASHALDRAAFLAHWSAARRLDETAPKAGGPSRAAALLVRYRFHVTLQGLLQQMLAQDNRLDGLFRFLGGKQQLAQADFEAIREALGEVRGAILDTLDDAKDLKPPALANVPPGATVHDLIVDRGDTKLPELTGDSISGEWIGKLKGRLDGVLTRVRRLHFKSLGGLLALQDQLAAEYAADQGEELPLECLDG